jgi:hypothetical protein
MEFFFIFKIYLKLKHFFREIINKDGSSISDSRNFMLYKNPQLNNLWGSRLIFNNSLERSQRENKNNFNIKGKKSWVRGIGIRRWWLDWDRKIKNIYSAEI